MPVKRGFKQLKKQCKNNKSLLRSMRRCDSCRFFYADENSPEEVCHNNSVTQFDFIDEGTRCYCCYWQPTWEE